MKYLYLDVGRCFAPDLPYPELIIFPTKPTPPLHSHISSWHVSKSKIGNLFSCDTPSSFLTPKLSNNQTHFYLLSSRSFHPTATFLKFSLSLPLPSDSHKSSYSSLCLQFPCDPVYYTGNNVNFLKIRIMFIPCLVIFIGPPPDCGAKSKFLSMVLKALPQLVPTYFSNLISWKSFIQTSCPSQTKHFSSSNRSCMFTPPLYPLIPQPRNLSPTYFLEVASPSVLRRLASLSWCFICCT